MCASALLLRRVQELVALGLTAPFVDKGADFSQLSPQPLYISDVLQSVSEQQQYAQLCCELMFSRQTGSTSSADFILLSPQPMYVSDILHSVSHRAVCVGV
jgi:hypothetical protein